METPWKNLHDQTENDSFRKCESTKPNQTLNPYYLREENEEQSVNAANQQCFTRKKRKMKKSMKLKMQCRDDNEDDRRGG